MKNMKDIPKIIIFLMNAILERVGSSAERRSNPSFVHQDAPYSPTDRESISRAAGSSPRGSVNGDGITSPQKEEGQSLAQKLQQKVSSVESLLRGSGRGEGLFRSPSRDSLVRSSSRESLTFVGENEAQPPAFDPPSDIESEAEEMPGSVETLSKEQLLNRLHRLERSLGNYRGKYSELVTAYRTVQRDKEKTQAILSQSQDKSLRRIGELREELQMDQQAKKHLQEEFDATLEEKDQMITVLQTQVSLLKKQLHASGGVVSEVDTSSSPDAVDASADLQSPRKDDSSTLNDEGSSEVDVEALQTRVKRQESLLQRCKEMIRSSKERTAQLGSENEVLQQQLQERLQELEKIKELYTKEKTKLIRQLGDARNLIEQLEQDKGMVIAETKRQMHETLEMKEEEIARLRSRLQQTLAQKDELQEHKEKSEKAAFEELERALGVAHRAEEARRQLQVSMEEQMKQVEKTSEEERKNLQQELTRVKQEVVTIMKKSSEDRIAELEVLHSQALANKEQELSTQIKQAVEQCREELLCLAQEREQQASLALEDAELQKAAIQAEGDNKVKELQLELESVKTRIQELESCTGDSEKNVAESVDVSAQIEELRKKHDAEIAALKENHQAELEKIRMEQITTLDQQHNVAMEELVQKHKAGVETVLKDKEEEFHSHVEEINQKMLDKLSDKQTELDTLSSEFSDVLKSKQQLEERISSMETYSQSMQLEFEEKLKEEQVKFQTEFEAAQHQNEQTFAGVEKTLKEELNQLKMLLEEKEKALEEHVIKEQFLQDNVKQSVEVGSVQLEELRQRSQSDKEALDEATSQISALSEDLQQTRNQVEGLEKALETMRNDCLEKQVCLERKTNELQELDRKFEQVQKDLSERENLHAETCKSMKEEQNKLRKQLEDQKNSHEKKLENIRKDLDCKLKSQENRMEKFKQKAIEAQEKLKKKLLEHEENAKTELSKKDQELQQKEQQLKEKIFEMAQASTEGLSTAVLDLEVNHKEKLEKLHLTQKREKEDLVHHWQDKLNQHEEEMQEKHTLSLQEKAQELEEISRQLSSIKEEKEQVIKEVQNLKEELAMRETTVQKLQTELRETASKLESVSTGEDLLKGQVETMEKNLNQALNERNILQDELRKAEDANKERIQSLSEELNNTQQKLNVLDASKCKEGEDLQKMLAEKTAELQNKEKDFHEHLCAVTKELEKCCQDAQVKLEGFSEELLTKVGGRVGELQHRIMHHQKKVAYLRNASLTKDNRIHSLEKELQQTVEENQNLKSAFDELTLQFNANSENLKALQAERETLQTVAQSSSLGLSEKDLRIEKLCKENKSISENLNSHIMQISNLESVINDLKTQLASSITEKEEAISLLYQQHGEEKERLAHQLNETVIGLEKEKSSLQEQADSLRNKLSELKPKFKQSHSTVKSLQEKITDLEKQMAEKDVHLQTLTASIDNHSMSKSEMDQALSEKEQRIQSLTSELESCSKKICELEEQIDLRTKELEQLSADLKQHQSIRENEKIELVKRLQEAQDLSSHSGALVQKTEESLQSSQTDLQAARLELESQRKEFETEKAEILRAKEEAVRAASSETTGKFAELKKKAEQKIGMVRKQLTSQIEEKEQAIRDLQRQLEEVQQTLLEKEERVKTLEDNEKMIEETVAKLKEEHERYLREVGKEKETSLQSLKGMYEEKLSDLRKEVSAKEEDRAVAAREKVETLLKVGELETKLSDSVEQITNYQFEISRLTASLLEHTAIVHELQFQIEQKQNEKLHKDYTRLQKDLRSLRKEHEKELDYLKKEMAEENEKMLKEFNTQMALKEKELDGSIKETIATTSVNREEVNQLQKLIAQKEEDLNRMVQRYELVLQNREEEMGGRVWEVQKELEELQQRSLSGPQTSTAGFGGKKLSVVRNESLKLDFYFWYRYIDLNILRLEHRNVYRCFEDEILTAQAFAIKIELKRLVFGHNAVIMCALKAFNARVASKEDAQFPTVKNNSGPMVCVKRHLRSHFMDVARPLFKIVESKRERNQRTQRKCAMVLLNKKEDILKNVNFLQKCLSDLSKYLTSCIKATVHPKMKTLLLLEKKVIPRGFFSRLTSVCDELKYCFLSILVTIVGNIVVPQNCLFFTFFKISYFVFEQNTEIFVLRKGGFIEMLKNPLQTSNKITTVVLSFTQETCSKSLWKENEGPIREP
ncbi:Golgin subfamily A member 4 tGolgin-1 [Triplophysa tibetana]|uniref:Golgin subfamily A member 4 tGolgin-1 n=1 Tax=Triplophysa tibetana TaxID=1572043 RepID=A0A5A9P972_9TELE|nr:Golgin subfamily A member 4 tGolgin-1 [Triplophysa tibetana]